MRKKLYIVKGSGQEGRALEMLEKTDVRGETGMQDLGRNGVSKPPTP